MTWEIIISDNLLIGTLNFELVETGQNKQEHNFYDYFILLLFC